MMKAIICAVVSIHLIKYAAAEVNCYKEENTRTAVTGSQSTDKRVSRSRCAGDYCYKLELDRATSRPFGGTPAPAQRGTGAASQYAEYISKSYRNLQRYIESAAGALTRGNFGTTYETTGYVKDCASRYDLEGAFCRDNPDRCRNTNSFGDFTGGNIRICCCSGNLCNGAPAPLRHAGALLLACVAALAAAAFVA